MKIDFSKMNEDQKKKYEIIVGNSEAMIKEMQKAYSKK